MSTDQGPHRVRASDQEREQYAEMIRAAMTEGRLSLAEGEERLAQVYAAKYRDELGPLTGDLPEGGWRALYDTPENRERLRRAARRGLGRHATIVAVVAAALITIWVLSPVHHFFWPAIPLALLTVGLIRHARWRRFAATGRCGPAGPWAAGRWPGRPERTS